MSTCACGKPYPERPWTLPVCGSCFVAVDAVANAFYYILVTSNQPAPLTGSTTTRVYYSDSTKQPSVNPRATHEHVAKLLVKRPQLLHAIEAAKRLGATPTQIRELCTEIEPFMRPEVP